MPLKVHNGRPTFNDLQQASRQSGNSPLEEYKLKMQKTSAEWSYDRKRWSPAVGFKFLPEPGPLNHDRPVLGTPAFLKRQTYSREHSPGQRPNSKSPTSSVVMNVRASVTSVKKVPKGGIQHRQSWKPAGPAMKREDQAVRSSLSKRLASKASAMTTADKGKQLTQQSQERVAKFKHNRKAAYNSGFYINNGQSSNQVFIDDSQEQVFKNLRQSIDSQASDTKSGSKAYKRRGSAFSG